MASDHKELAYEMPNVIRVYKDGTVDRIMATPYVSPSLDDPTTGVSSKDVVIVPDQVSARLYLPKTRNPKLPIFVYFHGGGFVLGSAFTLLEHNYLTTIVSHTNALVVSVEYRLAPEHLLPAAYEDCWTALQWVASHKQPDPEYQEPWLVEFGDFDRVYLGGDSAGGNIVHNMALQAGKESLKNDVKILGGFLGCPYFWSSTARLASTTADERLPEKCWMMAYPGAPDGIDNPLINPFVKPGFAAEYGCRKLLVVTAEKDLLRDIDVKYVEAVKELEWDGEIDWLEINGEDHCFYCFNGSDGKAKIVINRLAAFIV